MGTGDVMTSRKVNSSRKLSFQALENRMLMAANITSSVHNGALTLTGDKHDDSIQVTQPASSPNTFVVQGLNGTKIDGKTSKTFTKITGDFTVNFKAGNDTLTFGTSDANGDATSYMSLPRNLTVNLGDGDNNLNMYGASVNGQVSLTGGSGNDTFIFSEDNFGASNVNSGNNDCNIKLGAGGNAILMYYTSVKRDLSITADQESSEVLYVDGVNVGRNLTILTGKGDDLIQMDETNIGATLNVQTGSGEDNVTLGGWNPETVQGAPPAEGIYADQVYVDLGAEEDTLQIGGSNNNVGGGVYANHGIIYFGGDGEEGSDAQNDTVINETGMNIPSSDFIGFDTFLTQPQPHVVKMAQSTAFYRV
jgi:hypothetical protein